MRPTLQRRAWLLAAAQLSLGAAAAEPVSPADARAVRQVVEAQLAALAAGDAERAFSFASPDIRSQFGDAGRFIEMVRQGYPMVIRPAATAFFVAERVDGAVLLRVQLRDASGQRWLATYQLVQLADQPGQPWRINGVVVAADSGASST